MMYLFLKLIHILSATVMIGTGLGSAFYLFLTYKNCSVSSLRDVLKMVILADKIFTTPSVLLQLLTGIWLSELTGRTFSEWFWAVIGVSFLVFVLWVKAAFIQVRLDKILTKSGEITEEFHGQMRVWFWLGVPSFVGSMYIYYLMVFKNFP